MSSPTPEACPERASNPEGADAEVANLGPARSPLVYLISIVPEPLLHLLRAAHRGNRARSRGKSNEGGSMKICTMLLLAACTTCGAAEGKNDALSEASWPAGYEFSDCAGEPWCPTMIVVPGGTYTTGSPPDEPGRFDEEGPQREVRVRRFAVGKYHVTRGQWQAFARATGRATARGCHWTARSPGENDPAGSWEDTGFAQTGDHPVVCVTWHDVRAFVDWLGERTERPYRLLSEAEWEYAARAGSTTPYPWGKTADHEHANYGAEECCSGLATGRDEWEHTSPAGAFAANAFGLHDMHGNAMEWVQDCFSASYDELPLDGASYEVDRELRLTGPLEGMSGTRSCDYRMLRGGDWGNPGSFIRSAARNWAPPPGEALAAYRSAALGFRVARSLEPGEPGTPGRWGSPAY